MLRLRCTPMLEMPSALRPVGQEEMDRNITSERVWPADCRSVGVELSPPLPCETKG